MQTPPLLAGSALRLIEIGLAGGMDRPQRLGGRAPAARPLPQAAARSAPRWAQAPSLGDVLEQGGRLKLGMQGAAVVEVQKMLRVEADGRFGPATKAAVVEFQKSFGLELPPEQRGTVEKLTLEALKKASFSGETMGLDGISASGREQMERLLEYADSHHGGFSRGQCFDYVWRYLTRNGSGYGKLRRPHDAPDMPCFYARNFAEYMNAHGNAARWGLRRLHLTIPHEAPPGAVVVVASGSPGVTHPTAGSISVAAGEGRFIHDGPELSYGDPAYFLKEGGRVLGVYVPM